MFPYYARFMPMKKRVEAFNALSAFESKLFYQKLTMNKSKTCDVRYLRYCPLCVKEDRKQFGETYWHRVHQIRHISICPQHLCFLINSNIPITSTASPILITAEVCIGDMTVNLCNNITECRVAKYVAEVFQSPLNLDLDIRIGDYFKSKLIGTPYLSRRGEKRYMAQLHRDYLMYYEGVNIDTIPVQSFFDAQKLAFDYFSGKEKNLALVLPTGRDTLTMFLQVFMLVAKEIVYCISTTNTRGYIMDAQKVSECCARTSAKKAMSVYGVLEEAFLRINDNANINAATAYISQNI
jgi:hypothetical protein